MRRARRSWWLRRRGRAPLTPAGMRPSAEPAERADGRPRRAISPDDAYLRAFRFVDPTGG